MHTWSINFDKFAKEIPQRKDNLSINSAGTIWMNNLDILWDRKEKNTSP